MDWLDLLAVQGTLKSLFQHHSSKASILQCSAFFIVQLSHPYMTTGKIIALTRWTFVGKVMSLLFNMLSRLVITFLPRKVGRLSMVGIFFTVWDVKRLPAIMKTRIWSLGHEDPLEKEMAIHSNTIAWKIPWTEEPGRGRKESDTIEQLHVQEE